MAESGRSNFFVLARAAYEQAERRKRQADEARRSRARARIIALASMSAVVVALFIGYGMYAGWRPTAARWIASPRDAAARRFAETRTGEVRIPVRGNTCRLLQFNNESGRFTGSSFVPCSDGYEQPAAAPPPSKGLNSIRDSFAR